MSDLELTKSFQDKVYERIRDSIGDLMSDEDLKRLVEASMQKAFFEDREVPSRGYGYPAERKPSWLVEKVAELLKDRVEAAVKEWVAANPEAFEKAIEEAIAKGMFGLVLSYFEDKVRQPLFQFAQELRNKGLMP